MTGASKARPGKDPLLEEPGEGYLAEVRGRAGRMGSRKIERRLDVVPESVTEARRLVDEISDQIDPRLAEDLRVVVSELVTNVYKHSGLGPEEQVEVRLEVISAECVRGEVENSSSGFEVLPLHLLDPGAAGGRGLYIIDHLAERWGVQTAGGIACAWFEMGLVPLPLSPRL